MDDELKKKAYLEGMKLKKAGYYDEVICARLEKQRIPDELISQVLKNLSIQQKADVKADMIEKQKLVFDTAILKIGIGVFLAIISAILIPGHIYLPIGLIGGGIVYALISRSKMKG